MPDNDLDNFSFSDCSNNFAKATSSPVLECDSGIGIVVGAGLVGFLLLSSKAGALFSLLGDLLSRIYALTTKLAAQLGLGSSTALGAGLGPATTGTLQIRGCSTGS